MMKLYEKIEISEDLDRGRRKESEESNKVLIGVEVKDI